MSHQEVDAKLSYFADMSDEDLHAMQEAIMRERRARSSARVADMEVIDSDSDRVSRDDSAPRDSGSGALSWLCLLIRLSIKKIFSIRGAPRTFCDLTS